MKDCLFCQIANKEIPAKIIFENEQVICFLPKEMEVYGHTLVVPKEHYENLYDIPLEILAELMRVVKKLTIEYQQKIGATGMNLLHASGEDAQQSIFHFHFHLLPRFKNDGQNTWPNLSRGKIDTEEVYRKFHPE
jgi:histidine triad (HIT) family protein